jgi:Methyltransferase FkbM domain
MPSSRKQMVRIQIAPVDDICEQQGITKIDILKTDTEGYDAEVLAGARRMLSEERVRCIMCEVGVLGDKQHTDFTRVFIFLHRLGFAIAEISESSYFSNYRMHFTKCTICTPGMEE